MEPATRQAALEKLDRMTIKIGYPDRWRDYRAFHVVRGPYVVNVLAGREFEFQREIAKIGRPVDRTEWEMTPPTVNAYYSPLHNEIVFPAGSCSHRFLIRQPMMHSITAASVPSSGTNSRTESMTRGESSTPVATCATGGPRRMHGVSPSGPNVWPGNSTTMWRWTICTKTGIWCSARASPTWVASRSRTGPLPRLPNFALAKSFKDSLPPSGSFWPTRASGPKRSGRSTFG